MIQMEAIECGAAALGMVLGAYGRFVALPELRQACGVTRNGATARGLVEAARRYGLDAHGYKLSSDELAEIPLPAIAFWRGNHFVVLERLGEKRATICDPALGRLTLSREAFENAYSGLVIAAVPGEDWQPGGRPSRLWPALVWRLQGAGSALGFVALASLCLVVPGLAMPLASQIFIDQILIQHRYNWIMPLLGGLGLVALLKGGLGQLRMIALGRLRVALGTRMTMAFVQKLMALPLGFFQVRFPGGLALRVDLNTRVAGILTGRLATALVDLTLIGFYAALMCLYDGMLAAVAAGAAVLKLALLLAIGRSRESRNHQLGMIQGKLAGAGLSGLKAMETLKAGAHETAFFQRWSGLQAHQMRASQSLQAFEYLANVPPALISGLASVALIVLGGFQVMRGELTVGMLIAFQGLLNQLMAPLNNLALLGASLQALGADLTLLEDVTQASTVPVPEEPHSEPVVPRLELREVGFARSPSEPALLSGVSLALEPGRRIGVVGASGSGKSTLARLACGLEKPGTGEVCLGGVPIARVSEGVRVDTLLLVEQEPSFFPGTVRINLTLWEPHWTDEQLEEALAAASLLDDIKALPLGLGTTLTEGAANLSGGQRQRLALARTLLRRPRLLVLDEATSALDTVNERAVMRALAERGTGTLIIAHRLSTVADCDEILVLDGGRVAERGTHAALLAAGGRYATLWAAETPLAPDATRRVPAGPSEAKRGERHG